MLKYKKGDEVIISQYYEHSFDIMDFQKTIVDKLVVLIDIVMDESAPNPYMIRIGKEILGWCNEECILGFKGEEIEEITTFEHVVQRGETLYKIAKQYKTTYDRIAIDNKIVNPNKLELGQVLIINVEPLVKEDI